MKEREPSAAELKLWIASIGAEVARDTPPEVALATFQNMVIAWEAINNPVVSSQLPEAETVSIREAVTLTIPA